MSRSPAIFARIWLVVAAALLSTCLAFGAARSESTAITEAYAKARVLTEEGKAEEALPYAETALALARQELGAQHRTTGILAFNLGMLQLELGRSEEAKPALQEALSAYQLAHGEQSPELLDVLRNLGRAHHQLGELDEARELYERALPIAEAHSGKDTIEVAEILVSLSFVDSEKKRYRRVRSHGQRVLRIYQKQLGAKDKKVGMTYLGLASNEFQAGNLADGERYLKKGLAILEAELPIGDPSLLMLHSSVAKLYDMAGMTREAREFRDKVAEGRRVARKKREQTGEGE
jgi:tetratricopeptide (TPR) repeat protein